MSLVRAFRIHAVADGVLFGLATSVQAQISTPRHSPSSQAEIVNQLRVFTKATDNQRNPWCGNLPHHWLTQ